MYNIMWIVYRLPLFSVPFIAVFFAFFYGILTFFFNKLKNNVIKYSNFVFSLIYSFLIIYITILSREHGSYEYYLNPFNNFINSLFEKDFIRSMLMNVLLYVPFGSFLSLCFCNRKISFILIIIVAFSAFTEVFQYLMQVGVCETNDIIMNFVGGCTGSLSVFVYKKLNNKFGEKNEH